LSSGLGSQTLRRGKDSVGAEPAGLFAIVALPPSATQLSCFGPLPPTGPWSKPPPIDCYLFPSLPDIPPGRLEKPSFFSPVAHFVRFFNWRFLYRVPFAGVLAPVFLLPSPLLPFFGYAHSLGRASATRPLLPVSIYFLPFFLTVSLPPPPCDPQPGRALRHKSIFWLSTENDRSPNL